MLLDDKVARLLPRARKTIEILARKHHSGGAWGSGLCGYCGIASRFLISLAESNNIRGMKLVCGTFIYDNALHCWVEYKGFYIDLTISQFDFHENKKYKVGKVNDVFYRANYNPNLIGSQAVNYQKKWTEGQDYASYATILWKIYRENNGTIL